MLRFALRDDIETLSKMWIDIFQDDSKYVSEFYDQMLSDIRIALWIQNNEIIGMIHLIPCIISPDQKAYYWYAAGIKKEHRGKGIFTEFATQLLNLLNGEGIESVCVPVNGLYGMYEKLGFDHMYLADDFYYCDDKLEQKIQFRQANPFDFQQNKFPRGSTLWSDNHIKYAIDENSKSNGFQLKFQFEDKQYSCFIIYSHGEYRIDYHNIERNVMNQIQGDFLNYLHVDHITIRYPNGTKAVALSTSSNVNPHSTIQFTLE